MIDSTSTTIALAALFGIAVVLAVLLHRVSAGARPPPLYLDEGYASDTFASERYRIRAKPDLLERESGRGDGAVTLVELKSRARGIHASDRAQIIATALAVRAAGIDVRHARLETRDDEPVGLDLDASDETLFARIRPAVEAARLAVLGSEPHPTPSSGKCRACGYRERCPHRADRP